ncbi:MAG: hypothetical protein KA163_06975 [Bacteroidia bacterium]|nr:hypothetical protein [Bacteroidia bacterium]
MNLKLLLLALVAITITSCKTKGKAFLYTESSISPSEVKGRTVGILPNRLPVTLQNSEEWRKRNYESIKKILVAQGFSVVDYNTCNQMFQQSGLPLEDTKSSRDKYADLAQKMNADLLIFPYYGTTFSSTGFSNSYISIASLQFYSLKHNDFSARVDLEGVTKIQTWPQMVPYAGIIYQILILGPCRKGHKKAFNKAFQEGFNTYFSRFSGGSNGGGSSTPGNNSGGSKYGKYSVEELETLKKAAAANGDYKTAGEIKDELDKRKK